MAAITLQVFPLHCAGLNTRVERETAEQYRRKLELTVLHYLKLYEQVTDSA